MMRADGKLVANGDDGIDAVHLRHLQVHQRDIRPMRPELLDRLAAIGGLGDQIHVRLDSPAVRRRLRGGGDGRRPRERELAERSAFISRSLLPESSPNKPRRTGVCRTRPHLARAAPLRCRLPLRSRSSVRQPICSARSRMLGRPQCPGASGVQVLRIDALSIVPDAHADLPCAIRDLRFDVTGLCVPERIAQRLARNAVDVVAQDRMQVARRALDRHAEGRRSSSRRPVRWRNPRPTPSSPAPVR